MANESGRGGAGRTTITRRGAVARTSSPAGEQSAAVQPEPEPTPQQTPLARNGSRIHTTPTGTPPPVTNRVNHITSDADREARRRRVAEAAYYRAQQRGFAPGGEVDDWLEAEKEIESSESGSEK